MGEAGEEEVVELSQEEREGLVGEVSDRRVVLTGVVVLLVACGAFAIGVLC
ncbi:hypothetical protein [Streptomyces flavofungini]|uniref:hypothetical protein n=1 Tax=Streptomyces flavofungini TaxID=68200 RepID=UPI0025B21813|nr:hypothetical protein [Streptomyces flavofungini]WJV46634.1 hypothetical protein QUY26_14530 [Streptomyces flavofungini]